MGVVWVYDTKNSKTYLSMKTMNFMFTDFCPPGIEH